MGVKRQKAADYLLSVFHLAAMVAILAFVYERYIHLNNLYWGVRPLHYSASSLFLLFVVLVIIAFNFVRLDYMPSRIFLAIYSFIVVLPYAALNSVSGVISSDELIVSIFLTMLPLAIVAMMAKLPFLRMPKLRLRVKESWLNLVFLGLAGIGFFVFLTNATPSAGFSYVDSYTRRFEARDLYVSGSLSAYLLVAMINSILPFLSFKGANTGRYLWLGVAIAGCFFFFWLSGNKSQFFWVAVTGGLGLAMRRQWYRYTLQHSLFMAIWSLVVILAVEWLILDNYSYVSDFFLRRTFIVNAQTQGYYYDAILNARVAAWSLWVGASDGFSGPFYIGETYFNRAQISANASGFLEVFLERGVIGFALTCMLVGVFLRLLDALYKRSRKADYCFLALIFSFLLTEQKVTIVLFSSGILFLLIFISFISDRKSSGSEPS